MCDPLVVKSGKVQPASLALQSGGTSGFNLYNGGITCAIGTEKADAGSDAVIMAAMITATIFFSLTAFTIQVLSSVRAFSAFRKKCVLC